MATFDPGPLISNVTGTIAATTFSRSNAGRTISTRTHKARSISLEQLVRHKFTADLANAWRLASPNDRAQFADLAAALPPSAGRAGNAPWSAFTLWMSRGQALAPFGLAPLDLPLGLPRIQRGPPAHGLWVANDFYATGPLIPLTFPGVYDITIQSPYPATRSRGAERRAAWLFAFSTFGIGGAPSLGLIGNNAPVQILAQPNGLTLDQFLIEAWVFLADGGNPPTILAAPDAGQDARLQWNPDPDYTIEFRRTVQVETVAVDVFPGWHQVWMRFNNSGLLITAGVDGDDSWPGLAGFVQDNITGAWAGAWPISAPLATPCGVARFAVYDESGGTLNVADLYNLGSGLNPQLVPECIAYWSIPPDLPNALESMLPPASPALLQRSASAQLVPGPWAIQALTDVNLAHPRTTLDAMLIRLDAAIWRRAASSY